MKLTKKELTIIGIVGLVIFLLGVGSLVSKKYVFNSEDRCQPVNIFISKGGENGIKIQWETKESCLGYVLYGENSYEIDRVAVNIENLEKTKDHSVSISGLLSTTTYHFIVVSDENAYGSNGNPISLFLEDIE